MSHSLNRHELFCKARVLSPPYCHCFCEENKRSRLKNESTAAALEFAIGRISEQIPITKWKTKKRVAEKKKKLAVIEINDLDDDDHIVVVFCHELTYSLFVWERTGHNAFDKGFVVDIAVRIFDALNNFISFIDRQSLA